MATYREIVYLVLDELKIQSDDSYFEEEHVIFLINKFRPAILKQKYADVRKEIPEANFQSIVMNLQDSPNVDSTLYKANHYMRTVLKVPSPINLNGGQRIMSISNSADFWGGEITYVNRDRFKYVGNNKWLQNIVYGAINPDNYLYLKSKQSTFLGLNSIRITSIFENPIDVNNIDTSSNHVALNIDVVCPLEAGLIVPLIQMVVKELLPAQFRESDKDNNADDNSSEDYNRNGRQQNAIKMAQAKQQGLI